MTGIEIDLPIKSERNLYAYVYDRFRVLVPNKQVCPNHSTPWAAFADAFFARSPVVVVKASRGFGGKSYLISLLGSVEASLGCEVNILGGSGQQAKRVLEAMDDLWRRPTAPQMVAAASMHHKLLTNGASIQALMASQTSVRGPHPQRLRIDEADEMVLELLDASLGQPMSKGDIPAQTMISSTHQHADGTMTEVLRRARAAGHAIHEWCWRETLEPHGWLTNATVESTRATVPEAMWLTEYEGQEPNPAARAITPAAVERMFRRDLGCFKGADGEYIEIESPLAGARYAHGADWARKQDRTIIVTLRIDCRPSRVVAFEAMRRLEWPHMIGRFDQRVKRYGGSACHDGTGIGDVVHGVMRSKAEGVILVGRDRQDTISEYINDCEKAEIDWPFIEMAYNEHRYASQDDVYGSGHLPDSICAGGLARRAAFRQVTPAWASA